jgi:uncharacterized protein (TIGR02145 family)
MKKLITLSLLLSVAAFAQGAFTDSRDGKKYKTVTIGKQIWMAKNLDYAGEIYDWESAMLSCPDGWHLPDNNEWQTLITTAGGNIAGRKLKSRSGWEKWDCEWTTVDDRGRTTKNSKCNSDNYGFSALPNSINGNAGFWWTASENYSGASAIIMLHNSEAVQQNSYRKTQQLNVRCLKGEKKLPASLAAKRRAMEEAARIAAQKEAEKKACVAAGNNWFNEQCKTDEELAEAKCVFEGNVWVNDECKTEAEIAEENCIAAGNNWVNGECKTDAEVAEAACVAGGKIWTNGECGYVVLVPSHKQGNAITQQNNRQIYQIDLAQSGTLSVNVTTDGTSAALPNNGANVRWLNANNANVGGSSGVSFPYNESNYLAAGRYYIEVIGLDGVGNTGKYSIHADYFTDEISSNYTINTAQLLISGLTVKGSITAQKNTGVYKYVLTKPGRLSVNVTGGTLPSQGVNILWLNADGNTIKGNPKAWGMRLPYNEFMDLEAGTYYISIVKYNKNTGTYNLRGNFTVAENNEIEPNETRGTAQLLTSGQTVKGFISHQDGTDMYRIELTQAGRLTLNVTGGTLPSGGVNILWLNTDGNTIKGNPQAWGMRLPYNEFMDLEAGTYYISIVKYNNNTGTYNLTVQY